MLKSHRFKTKHAVENFRDFRELWDTPLFESQSFVALPTVGALVEGWILVVPRTPTLSFACVHKPQFDELEAFLKEIVPVIQSSYGPVAVFEHGPSQRGSKVGCGVDYAHLHLIPTIHGLKKAAAKLAPNIGWEEVGSLRDIRRNSGGARDYWFVQERFGSSPCFIGQCNGGNPPSQLFRRVIANNIGRPSAYDWKMEPGAENIVATCNTLSQSKMFV